MLKDTVHLGALVKSFAHAHRIGILVLLDKTTGLSVGELADVLGISFRSASEHSTRLALGGLITKSHSGQQVEHSLTPSGKRVVKFLKDFQLKPKTSRR